MASIQVGGNLIYIICDNGEVIPYRNDSIKYVKFCINKCQFHCINKKYLIDGATKEEMIKLLLRIGCNLIAWHRNISLVDSYVILNFCNIIDVSKSKENGRELLTLYVNSEDKYRDSVSGGKLAGQFNIFKILKNGKKQRLSFYKVWNMVKKHSFNCKF